MVCTGAWNGMIFDTDGKFFGQRSTSISNNPFIGPNLTSACTKNDAWNGYICNKDDFAIVEFENIGWDRQRVMNGPVFIDNSVW